MSAKVVVPQFVDLNAGRVPNAPTLATADGLGSANVGVIIDSAENLTLHGAPDNENGMVVVTKNATVRNSSGQEVQIEKNECRNIGAWFARWLIEMAATGSLLFIATAAALLNPEGVFGAPFIVAFSLFGITMVTHVLFNYATGVYMNVYTSFWATIAHWIVRGMSSESIYFLNDIVKLLIIWSAQIVGSFAGVIVALLLFLDGTTLVSSLAAMSAPRYGVASWLPGPPVQVTDYQAGAIECIGTFMVTITVLYCYGAKELRKKNLWGGLIRGGSIFIATILFYSLTGASFNPFRWVVPLAYAGAGYGSVKQQLVYTLVPFIGGAIATLFFVIWVAVNQYCIRGSMDDSNESKGYKKLQEAPENSQSRVQSSVGGLLKNNVSAKLH